MRKNLPILSLQNRFLNLFAHTYIFEVEYYSDSSNIMDSYNDFYKCPFNSYDLFDYMYLCKYLLESYDLNLSQEELQMVNNLNDNYLILNKNLRQYTVYTIENANLKYDNEMDEIDELYEKTSENIKINSMKIYNIIKQYI